MNFSVNMHSQILSMIVKHGIEYNEQTVKELPIEVQFRLRKLLRKYEQIIKYK